MLAARAFGRAAAVAALVRLVLDDQLPHVDLSLFQFDFVLGFDAALVGDIRRLVQVLFVLVLLQLAVVRSLGRRLGLLVGAMLEAHWVRQDCLLLLVVRRLRQVRVVVLVDHFLPRVVLAQPEMPG